ANLALAIRVLFDQPMRNKGLATWDGGKTTWGGRVEAMGTIPVCMYAQESWGEETGVLAGESSKIIKEQVRVRVKEQVTKILPRIEKLLNEQLEAEVLTRSSNEAKTSHAVAANLSTGKFAQVEEPIHIVDDLEELVAQEFDTGFNEDQPVEEASQLPDYNLARNDDSRDSFNELMDTPLDFSAFMMNRLKVDTLTLKLLAGPTFELMKGSCKSLVELEYFLEEVYKETTDQLDWNNPEGRQYPHDLRKPLPLIQNSQGLRVIPFDHFINNDLAYLRGGASSRTYAMSVIKTKAADYGYNKWIEDLVPSTMWSPVSINYKKHALWESPTRDANVNNSMDMPSTGNLLGISTL
nr:hypothetical protein [Tanacetum cinerariifolium]